MDRDLSAALDSGEVGRQRRYRLQHVHIPVVEAEHVNRCCQFVHHVHELSIGTKGQMPRPGTERGFDERRRARGERPFSRIEAIDHHAIGAQVGNQHEAVVRRNDDFVGVRTLLPFPIHTRSGVLNEARRFSQLAV